MLNMEKYENHKLRMKKLHNGDVLDCPFCKKGKFKAINDYASRCDTCGKGIVGRVNIDVI